MLYPHSLMAGTHIFLHNGDGSHIGNEGHAMKQVGSLDRSTHLNEYSILAP